MSSRDGIHLDDVVAVQLTVSVSLIQKGGTNPVGITFDSFHLKDENIRGTLVDANGDQRGLKNKKALAPPLRGPQS